MQETCARLQSRSNTPQAGPGIMSRWTEDCISCPHLCYQLQHITSLDDTLLSLFLKKRKKKKKGGGLKNQYHYLDPSVKWGHSKNSHQNLPKSMCVCAKSLQLCLTLCDPMDCSPPGSSVHGIGEWTRILEWVAMLSFRGSSRPHQRLLNLLHCGGFMTTRDR